MSATSQSLHDEDNTNNAQLPQNESERSERTNILPQTLKNDILCINKNDLINSFYQLHQNNLILNASI